jgi:hypothetical protein
MSHTKLDEGGICYVACDELFEYYNNSRFYCYKGCDYSHGRVSYPDTRRESEKMCKRMTAEALNTQVNLEKIKDLRVSAGM